MSTGRLINILQSILTVLMTVAPTILLALGCTQNAVTGELDCSAAIVSPWTMGKIVIGLGLIKTVVLPWLAPGGWVRNMFGDRAVVTSTPAPGTVSPTDVR